MKVEWKKCPSVTHGGKPFFWVTTNVKQKFWVVWDRFAQEWAVMKNPTKDGEDSYVDWFSSPNQAKSFVERIPNEETYVR